MSWNPQPAIGGANWFGNPSLTTNTQLISTTGGINTQIVTTSNYLQTEINAIVVGGGAALWANYRAVSNVDLSGHTLINSVLLSTMDLQVSSINGADINFNKETVTVGGVTIVGGTVNTSNVTIKPTAGGSGGGGNNPTSGGSGNNVFSMINSAVGATMDTVSKTQQAISGILNNTGAVLFQTYYAVETAGAIIDLANGAVQLATNAQALYDTREQNLIAGPGGPPGQTSYVYETINGTTQLQFSTLGAPVYTVFRTTDQVNPNQTFGREIFTSTIIPAGSKVVRSASDPYQFNIMSTQLLSTTNYMQSFGQWHAILEPDYNLKASTLSVDYLRASTISTVNISTGAAWISSINGSNINTILTPTVFPVGLVSTPWNIGLLSSYISTFSTFTVSSLFAKNLTVSSGTASSMFIQNLTVSSMIASSITVQNIIDNYVSTTTGQFDVLNTSSLNANTIDSLAIITNNLQANVIGGLQAVNLSISTGNSFSVIYPTRNLSTYVSTFSITQNGFYNFETNAAPSPPSGIVYINSPYEVFVYNQATPYGTTNQIQQLIFIQPQYAGTAYSGTFTFYAVGSAGFNIQFIQAGDGLAPAAAPYIVEPGYYVSITYSYPPGEYQNCSYRVTTLFSPTPGSATSTLTTSQVALVTDVYETVLNTSNTYKNSGTTTSYLGNLALNVSTIAFGSNTSRNNTIPYTFNGLVNPTGIVFTSLPTPSYDITNSFASTTTQTYNAISSLTQNILNYNLSATAATAGIINFGLAFVCNSANVADWEQQVLTTNYVGNAQIGLFSLDRTAYFDVYRSVGYSIIIYDWTTGSQRVLFSIDATNTTTYRVTGTVAGAVTTWSYTTSPGTGTATTTNNLTVSQDLQNVYVSTLNRLQVNAGDIYLNGPTIMGSAFANKLYADAAYVSSISTGSIFAGNLSLVNATVQSLTATNNISSYNQVAIIQTDGNAQKVQPLEIYTNYTTVGEPSYGYYSPFRTYDNLSTVNMITSQMKYNVYDGYVNVGLGSVSNITFDSNYDLYINNVYLGRPGNKASLGFTSIPYNGGLGSFSGAMIRILTTLPNPPGTALNAFSVTLSNRSGAGGSDYVHLYGSGWNSGQVNTDIYMPTYSTGNPAVMYNQAGSNTISILAGSPGTPFPNTNQTTIPNDTVSITHVPGGALSSIIQIASPILNLNSQLYWGSNTKRISMFSMRMVAFLISKTAPGGQAYGFADVGGFVTDVNGNLFKTSDYTVNCTFGQVNCESQRTLALNSCSLTTEDNGGYWFVHCYATTPTVPAISSGGNDVVWAVNVLAMPTELASFQNFQPSQNVGDVIPSSIGAFELQAQLIAPNSHLSSITASTITLQASENASFLAGNFTVPTYFSTGSITVGGTNQVSLLANIVAIGAQTDVDIQANSGNVNVVGGSNIHLVACNYFQINAGSYMNTDVYGDMTTDLGGVYTVTSAEVINLNGSNGIGLNSSNAINLTASSNVTINTVTTIQIPGTASIPSVSPLALTNGGDYANNQNKSQIEFQYYGNGGFNHYISSRHDANVVYGSGNAIDFWLYSVYTGGDAQTASSAPGTGNVNTMSLTASNVVINRPIQISDSLTGGVGTLTVDSGNHLYWNGTLIA